MRLLITGGGGFIGQTLAQKLLAIGTLNVRGQGPAPIRSLTIFDQQAPITLNRPEHRLSIVTGDLTNPADREHLFAEPYDCIFHLGAIPSGGSEKAFERGLAVNFDATRALLEHARQLEPSPLFIYSSTTAVFGGALPDVVPDEWAPTPTSSYGIAKAMSELLVNEYSRRGFVDGRALRLPTIVVRGGKPNTATSTFASSIIREPLNGERATCPVTPETTIWIMSPEQVVNCLLKAAALPAASLGDNRIITLPGLAVSVAEMVAALKEIAGPKTVGLIDWKHDPFIQRIVGSWPTHFTAERALALGFTSDHSIHTIIEQHHRQK